MRFVATPGTEIAGYRILSEVGRGGSATVYLADHPGLGRRVALKILSSELAEDDAFAARFSQEARIAAGMEHPNVLPVYDAGEWEGLLYIAMRYVDGTDLAGILERKGASSLEWALPILSQIAAALDAAHAKGLVHRDVKPANILIDPGAGPGGRDHAYLTDFGLARPALGASGLTKAGEIYGTIDYMPPEQLSGGVVDARSDIYAFSCLAYACLTGAPPFRRDTMLATAAAQMHEAPTPPSLLRPDLPVALDEPLTRGLAKDKASRYRSAFELVEAVSAAIGASSADMLSAVHHVEPGLAVAARESRKTVTIAVLEVEVERADDLDPELLRTIEARVAEETRSVFRLRDAMVEPMLEGPMLAVLGVPELHEDDALRAVDAAVELREAVRRLGGEFETPSALNLVFRCGIGTGTVVVDDGAPRGAAMSGQVLGVASRIRSAGASGDILIDDATHRLVHGSVSAEPYDPSPVPNATVFRVLDVHPKPPSSAELGPFVGRSRELAMLRQALSHVIADRACHVLTILGPAGVGKSRLLGEFLDESGAQANVVTGRCLSYGRGITYWPLAEMVRQAAGISEDDTQERALQRIAEIFDVEDGPTLAERVGGLLGLADAVGSPQEAFSAVRRFFEAQARRRPIVLVFEDVHWAEPALLDLIEHVADLSNDAPMLVVCPAREEFLETRPGWGGGRPNATSILLEPLDEMESADLVRHLLSQTAIPAMVQARVSQAAGGNPLFVEELVRMLIDERLIARGAAGQWTVAGDLTSLAIPPTIQALLAARLGRLEVSERDLLGCGSVEGAVFHAGSVGELLGADGDLQVRLGSLARKGLIRPTASEFAGEEAFRFRHQLIRDAAYETVRKQDRATFHARFAAWLQARAGARATEYDEILGYHLEAAFGYRRELARLEESDRQIARSAAGFLGSAGRRALARSDMPAAANLLSRARELVLDDDSSRLDLGVALSDALIEVGQLPRAEQVLDETIAEAAKAGDRVRGARSRVLRSFLRGHRDDPVGLDGGGARGGRPGHRGVPRGRRRVRPRASLRAGRRGPVGRARVRGGGDRARARSGGGPRGRRREGGGEDPRLVAGGPLLGPDAGRRGDRPLPGGPRTGSRRSRGRGAMPDPARRAPRDAWRVRASAGARRGESGDAGGARHGAIGRERYARLGNGRDARRRVASGRARVSLRVRLLYRGRRHRLSGGVRLVPRAGALRAGEVRRGRGAHASRREDRRE